MKVEFNETYHEADPAVYRVGDTVHFTGTARVTSIAEELIDITGYQAPHPEVTVGQVTVTLMPQTLVLGGQDG